MTEQEKATMAQMDEAADEARQELMDGVILSGGKARDVAGWMKKWYAKAGYKRLCRILMELAP